MISRRALTAGLSAIPIGIAGGLFFHRKDLPQSSIRFLGNRGAMVACLDVGSERVLFILGDNDPGLLPFLPQLLTVGRTRVDLIIASHKWLTTDGIRDVLDLADTPTLSLQQDISLAPIVGDIRPITSYQMIGLGGDATIAIRLQGSTDREANDPGVLIEIDTDGTILTLVSDEAALDPGAVKPDLLAIPGDVQTSTVEHMTPALFVGSALHRGSNHRELQMFRNEPVGVSISDGSLTIHEGQFSS